MILSRPAAYPVKPTTTYDPRAHGAQCDRCPLRKQIFVPPEPPRSGMPAKFAAVAEHPGLYEEKMLRPLVGPAGQIFDRALTKAGVKRSEGWITNAILCRGDEKDMEEAYTCCAPRLLRELADIPAGAPILTMGGPATRTVLGVRSIYSARGFVWTAPTLDNQLKTVSADLRRAEKKGHREDVAFLTDKRAILDLRQRLAERTVLPTLNTIMALKLDAWRPVIEKDIARFGRWLRGDLRDEDLVDRGEFETVSRAIEVRRALARLADVVSLDIETDGVDALTSPILCTGLADRCGRVVVIGPWRAEVHARLLTDALRTRTAVMHNGYNFDQIALERDGVRFPRGTDGLLRVEDTLTAHHTFAGHMFQRLGHVASVFLDCSPWKITSKGGAEEKGVLPAKMEPEARHRYNSYDARVQIGAWFAMQAELAREMAVYKHDKAVAEVCKQMHIDGIRRDPVRAVHLLELMRKRNLELAIKMKRLAGKQSFSPTKLADVRKALFGRLRAPVLKLTPKGLVSTSSGTLEALKTSGTRAGEFAEALLDFRAIDKVRSTYIERVEVHADGRVHPVWKPFGAATGRWSSRIQSVPRLVFTRRAQQLLAQGKKPKEVLAILGEDATYEIESRIREVYVPDEDHVFLYFDLSQSEMRVAAYISGDDAFIASCESGDVHTANARILFASDPAAVRILDALLKDPKNNALKSEAKLFRDITKNAGFGILYKADVETIFQFLRNKGFEVEIRDVAKMFDTIHATYHVYYKFCDRRLAECKRTGYLRSILLGRKRVFGFNPKPTEIYNTNVQSFVADLMNIRMLEMRARLPKRIRFVGQWHDALVMEARVSPLAGHRESDADLADRVIKETWEKPIYVPSSGRTFVMPADRKRGVRLSDFC